MGRQTVQSGAYDPTGIQGRQPFQMGTEKKVKPRLKGRSDFLCNKKSGGKGIKTCFKRNVKRGAVITHLVPVSFPWITDWTSKRDKNYLHNRYSVHVHVYLYNSYLHSSLSVDNSCSR